MLSLFSSPSTLVLGRAPVRSAQMVSMQATDAAFGASHTSFYTDAVRNSSGRICATHPSVGSHASLRPRAQVKKDKYDTLDDILATKLSDKALTSVVKTMFDAASIRRPP